MSTRTRTNINIDHLRNTVDEMVANENMTKIDAFRRLARTYPYKVRTIENFYYYGKQNRKKAPTSNGNDTIVVSIQELLEAIRIAKNSNIVISG